MRVSWLGTEETPDQWDHSRYPVERAASRDEAHRVLTGVLPEILVVDGAKWAQDVVRSLPQDARPAVVAVGLGARTVAASADEWIPHGLGSSEISMRLEIAMQRARIHRRFARRAMLDPLTRLPNRRAAISGMLRGAAGAKRRGTALSLVLLDLDDFKSVNERDGHAAGDRLLRKVGATLARATRGEEVCARIGGDEFAVVISGNRAEADSAAHRVQAALAAEGVSGSVATGELKRGEQLRELYRRVDFALKAKKEERRSTREPRALVR